MAFLIDLLEEGALTDFSDIRNAYAKHKTAQDAYWNDLQTKAYSIYRGFEHHVGLAGQKFATPGKPEEAYCQVGVMESGKFKQVLGPSFSGSDLQVEFAIRLVVDESPISLPKKALIIQLRLGKSKGGYLARLKTNEGWFDFSISFAFAESELKDLYEAIALDVIDSMDESIFG
ncbi:hypothetical protein [Pseudomonas sp. F1002]|uniref:hypothetical protein n=1 Tax=Pseudomonas sp. F1002 TaxID=2738821 RepID=UPI0015A1A130|nr:hypothetical protein [Pseudomonas sp. F1002]NWB64467.1 hypothetical protein [Pseudomonas sp. F1002]